jgi:chromosome segregation ATPase
VDKVAGILRANDEKIADLESRASRAEMTAVPEKTLNVSPASSVAELKNETAKKTALTLELQEKNIELSTKLQEREKELADAQNAIQSLRTELASLKGDSDGRTEELRQLSDRLEELDSSASRKATALTEQKENLSRFTKQLNTFESQIADLKSLIARKDAALEKQDNFILGLEEKMQRLDTQRASLQEENDFLKVQLASLQGTPTTSPANRDTIITLKQAIAERDEKINEIGGENRRLSAMIKIYESQTRTGIRTPVRQAAAPAVNAAVRQEELDQTMDQQENAALIKNLQEELAVRDKALAAAQAMVAEFELKSSAGEVKQDAMKNVIEKRDDQVASVEKELEQAKADLTKATAEIAQLRELQNKLFISENRLKDSGRDMDDLKMEVAQVRDELRKAHESMAKKDVALSKMERERTSLQDEIAHKPMSLKRYQEKMKAYIWKTTQDIRDLKNKVKEIEKRLADKNSEISKLQQKIQQQSVGSSAAGNAPNGQAKTEGKNNTTQNGNSGCLLQCEDQQKTSGDMSGCLLNCVPQK